MILRLKRMARRFKTNPFRTRGQIESTSNTEGENKDEDRSSSSSSTTSSGSNSEEKTQDKKLDKAEGKRPMQAKRRKKKRTLVLKRYESLYGPGRAKRARENATSYVVSLGSQYPLTLPLREIDEHVSSEFEPTNADRKHKGKDKAAEVLQGSEEQCKQIGMEGNDDNDDDRDGDGPRTRSHKSTQSGLTKLQENEERV